MSYLYLHDMAVMSDSTAYGDKRSIRTMLRCNAKNKYRAYVFTIPNYDEEDIDLLQKLYDDKMPNTFVVGKEIAPTTGTPHLQGYIYFLNQHYPKSLLRYIHKGFIDQARGSPQQNIEYCSKSGDMLFDVVMERQMRSKRNDVLGQKIVELCEKKTPSEIMKEEPGLWLSYSAQILRTLNALSKEIPPTWDGLLCQKNVWIYGPPRTGKSRWAHSQTNSYMHKLPNKWWNGYSLSVDCVIYEDFDPNSKGMAQYIKIWSDRYPFTAEVKGTSITIDPGRWFFIVTSNYSIDECFENSQDVEAIKSRFTTIWVNSPSDIQLIQKLDKSILRY